MNDPGLDQNISNDADDVEDQKGEVQSGKEADEQAYLEPSRWWFASTAFPLIAGTFGPMGSAFSICALVVPWRVYVPPGATEATGIDLPDPKWLVGINAVQLAIALVSNLFLLLNMARRVKFSIAQPITIIGWYMSSFILTALCACTSGPLAVYSRKDHAITGAFYYGVFAASLYFIVATMMLVTVWGASKGHYAKEFQLTMSQRTLMLQTIFFLVYLLSGAAIYSRIEGWKFLDAVYWADFTLLTVGIGDFAPMTHAGRSLLFPFAIGGIIILGLVIGSIRSLVLERGKVKMGSRMVEKERRRLLQRIQKKSKDAVLEPVSGERAAIPRASTKKFDDEPTQMTELERRRQEFDLMRRIQEEAARKRRWTSLVISGGTWFVLWFAGAAIFQAAEKPQSWTYFVSLYFAYTSLLTIGYGDFSPQSNSGKAFFVFWSLLAVPSLTILISNMGDTIVKGIRDLTLWVGNYTVLPGEKGARVGFRENVNKITRGHIFKKEGNQSAKDGGDSKSQPHDEEKEKEILESKIDFHLQLIQEISRVTSHLSKSPPKNYTFEEWAWYLKLIGEDEGDATTHRKAMRKPDMDNGQTVIGETTEGDGRERVEWSWVGNKNPLMGEKEEAEWVLERLIKKLERELEIVRSGENGGGKGVGEEGNHSGHRERDR